jgi:hypothetical protein
MMAGAAWAWRDAAQLRTQYENAAAELYATRMRLAAEAIADGKLAEVRDLLTMGQPLSGEPDPRGWEWAYLANRLRGPAETILHKDQAAGLHFPPPTPSPVALSPDGQRRATITATGGLEIHDATGRLLLRLPVPGGKTLTGVQFSHDGRWLAARTTDDDLVVFDGAPGGLARE